MTEDDRTEAERDLQGRQARLLRRLVTNHQQGRGASLTAAELRLLYNGYGQEWEFFLEGVGQ